MKKTYNVISTKMTLKKLSSVLVVFAFFFLGLSSSVTAQTGLYSSSNAESPEGNPLIKVVSDTKITMDDEDVLTLVGEDLSEVRDDLKTFVATTTLDEPRIEAKYAFLSTAMMQLESGFDSKEALLHATEKYYNYLVGMSPSGRNAILQENFVQNFIGRLN